MDKSLLRITLSLFVVISSVSAGITGFSGETVGDDVYTIDEDHGLTDSESVQQYRSTGYESTKIVAPSMSISIASDHEQTGLEGMYVDSANTYLRVQYNESVSRTIRFYVPSEYWHPYTSLDVTAENTDVTADFRPTVNGNYTAVTIRVTGPTDSVFKISDSLAFSMKQKDRYESRFETVSGTNIPEISTGGEWEYVPESSLNGTNITYPINPKNGKTLTLQYDTNPSQGDERWIPVSECGGQDVPVCQMTKDGSESVYLVSEQADPPSVRYKTGSDPVSQVRGGFSEVGSIFENIAVDVSSLLDSVFGVGGSK